MSRPPILNSWNETGQYIITYDEEQFALALNVARAVAATEISKAHEQTNIVTHKYSTLKEIGDPRDLHNYLLDLGASEHITPCVADSEDVVEGKH